MLLIQLQLFILGAIRAAKATESMNPRGWEAAREYEARRRQSPPIDNLVASHSVNNAAAGAYCTKRFAYDSPYLGPFTVFSLFLSFIITVLLIFSLVLFWISKKITRQSTTAANSDITSAASDTNNVTSASSSIVNESSIEQKMSTDNSHNSNTAPAATAPAATAPTEVQNKKRKTHADASNLFMAHHETETAATEESGQSLVPWQAPDNRVAQSTVTLSTSSQITTIEEYRNLDHLKKLDFIEEIALSGNSDDLMRSKLLLDVHITKTVTKHKEEEIKLKRKSNDIKKEAVEHKKKIDQRKEAEKEVDAFKAKCQDSLLFGIFLMIFLTVINRYRSHMPIIDPLVSRCDGFPMTKHPWSQNFFPLIWRWMNFILCGVSGAVRLLVALVIFVIFPLLLYRTNLLGNAYNSPMTKILFILGIVCGGAGWFVISSIGGNSVLWLALWEFWTVIHYALSQASYKVFESTNSQDGQGQAQNYLYALRAFSGFVLPILIGFLPFYGA